MAIRNTHTEEFNWVDYGTTVTNGSDEQLLFLNDFGHQDFQDAGGTGINSDAYNNWKNVNRVMQPTHNYACPAVVGSVVKGSTGETYLAGVNSTVDQAVNFVSDGVFFMPNPEESPTDEVHETIQNNYQVEFHCKDPAGLEPGKFYPMLHMSDLLHNGHDGDSKRQIHDGQGDIVDSWSKIESFDQWLTYEQQPRLVNESSIASSNWVPGGYHRSVVGLQSTQPSNTIRSQASALFDDDWQGTDAQMGNYMPWGSGSNSETPYINETSMRKTSQVPDNETGTDVVIWYGHDGAGNGMLLMTQCSYTDMAKQKSGTVNDYVIYSNGSHYNSHHLNTTVDHSDPQSHPYWSVGGYQSGQVVFNLPKTITSMTGYGSDDNFIHTLAAHQKSAGTRVLVDPQDSINPIRDTAFMPTANATVTSPEPFDQLPGFNGRAGVYNDDFSGMMMFGNSQNQSQSIKDTSDKLGSDQWSHVLCFPTSMGDANAAALKTPQTMFISNILSTNNVNNTNVRPTVSMLLTLKFGNILTNMFPVGDVARNGFQKTDFGWTANSLTARNWGRNVLQSISWAAVASVDGNIGVNKATWNNQQTTKNYIHPDGGSYQYSLNRKVQTEFMFAEPTTSYNALSEDTYSEAAGTLSGTLSAWTNPQYVLDESTTGTIATNVGIDNALHVKLSESTVSDGQIPADDELVDSISVQLGNVRKLVMSDHVLKVAIYSNNNDNIDQLLAGPVSMVGDTAVTIETEFQVTFDDWSAVNPTYGQLKDAWLVMYVDSPE